MKAARARLAELTQQAAAAPAPATPIAAAAKPMPRSVESGIAMAATNARRIVDGNAEYSTPSTTRTRASAVSRSCIGALPVSSPERSSPAEPLRTSS